MPVNSHVRFLPENTLGKDKIIGDVHGEVGSFKTVIAELGENLLLPHPA